MKQFRIEINVTAVRWCVIMAADVNEAKRKLVAGKDIIEHGEISPSATNDMIYITEVEEGDE